MDKINNEYIMYIFINNDLKMSKGKIASQTGHVVQMIVEHVLNNKKSDEYQRYMIWKKNNGYTKIILKATYNDLVNLMKQYQSESKFVIDEGRTEIEPGSLTCVGFFPNVHPEFRKYSLL